MNRRSMALFLILICFSLSACGPPKGGVYRDEDSSVDYSFVRDCDRGVMWLSDARVPGSLNLTYQEALDYVALVNADERYEFDDWRLPRGAYPDEIICDRHTAGTDSEGNDLYSYFDCRETDFGSLFYDALGGCIGKTLEIKCVNGTRPPNDNPNLDLFDTLPLRDTVPATVDNVISSEWAYWTEMESGDKVWTFNFYGGSFGDIIIEAGGQYGAWLVRDAGDGCAPTPTP